MKKNEQKPLKSEIKLSETVHTNYMNPLLSEFVVNLENI